MQTSSTPTEPDGPAAPSIATFLRECVFCYVARMLAEFGCDGTLRWAQRWRDVRMPRALGLERRLEARGAYCDCEIFWNGWDLAKELQVPDEDGGRVWPVVRPTCAGGRASRPCDNWVQRSRSHW